MWISCIPRMTWKTCPTSTHAHVPSICASMRNVFLTGRDPSGNADLAVNAGFLNGADLSDAEHGIYYAWSDTVDAMRRYKEENRLKKRRKGTRAGAGRTSSEREPLSSTASLRRRRTEITETGGNL